MPTESIVRYRSELDELARKNLTRELAPKNGIDFTSNDFLALSNSPEIRETVIKALQNGLELGSGGSRLLRGNHDIHRNLEHKSAKLFGSDRSLYFANGYSANYALLTTLPKRHDLIIFDALSHASIREGISASHANSAKFDHNDVYTVEQILSKWQTNKMPQATAWIVVESLYSMDGDQAPLKALFDIAQRFNSFLVVDEAHATGVFGKNGFGFTEPYSGKPNLIVIHTCGKALGTSGALVCATGTIIDYLINKCRPFIYSTAPSPINAVAVSAALEQLESDSHRRSKLWELILFANEEIERRFSVKGTGSQIIPFVIGDDKLALEVAHRIQAEGFDVRAIRPPTVPPSTARLRISVTLHVTKQQIADLFEAIDKVLCEMKINLP